MQSINFEPIDSLEEISKNFGICVSRLENYQSSADQSEFYERIELPKSNPKYKTKFRTVYKADDDLNNLNKNIYSHLYRTILSKEKDSFLHQSSHGFVKNKGILTNASKHLDKDNILCLDLKHFFKSINSTDIHCVFKKLGFTDSGAKLFSSLCTINGLLEEGLHTSPLLANLHCYDLDEKLLSCASNSSATYTRYADDISISSNHLLPKLVELTEIIENFGLVVNNKKTRYRIKGHAQYITGLSVSNKIKPRIPRKKKNQLRMTFYLIETYGLNSYCEQSHISPKWETQRLYGWINFLKPIEHELHLKYKAILDRATEQYERYIFSN